MRERQRRQEEDVGTRSHACQSCCSVGDPPPGPSLSLRVCDDSRP